MNRAMSSRTTIFPTGLMLGLALLVVALVASVLPWSGHTLSSLPALPIDGGVLRFVLLLVSYTFVGIAAYRQSGDALASAVAVLLGAALGWAGWEWQPSSLGWPLFGAILLILSWPGERPALLASGLALIWALLDPSAAWGVLLLFGAAVETTREPRRQLWLAAGGFAVCALLVVRGVDIISVLLPATRQWVWADGQAQTTLADPAGLGLFALLLALLGLKLLRPTHSFGGLALLAVLGFLAWRTRSNSIWLGLAAVPVLGQALGGDWPDLPVLGRFTRPAILGAATCVGVALLLVAALQGRALIGGTPIPAEALQALPDSGLLAYRPEYEPALLRVRERASLALARPDDPTAFSIWERIAANCEPAAELAKLQAAAIVLDPRQDASVISALQEQGWRSAWSDDSLAVLLQPAAS